MVLRKILLEKNSYWRYCELMDNIVLTEKLKRKEEIINSNISSIGMSENLIAVKRVCRQLETKGFNFDVQDSYLEKLLIQGMKE